MILEAFAKYIKTFDSSIPAVILLSRWLKKQLAQKPTDNVGRVIHEEICLAKNNMGAFMLVGRSESGRKLIESLYNFALSYEHQNFSRWIHDKKASDFKS